MLSGDIYFVVDLEIITRESKSAVAIDWLSNFPGLFESLTRRGQIIRVVKVLLIRYSNELPFDISPGEESNHFITARLAAGSANKWRGRHKFPGYTTFGSLDFGRTAHVRKE